jgi:thiamine pyrophosphate-dependent acetolactate synthase large subunit-like protein
MSARYGSDVIVDLLVEAGIEHVAFNPGASFRGIHDSLVQRADGPQLALCLHEAVAVSVAQGYAKAAGRPMGVLLHDVVGLQNASMAIYNAWCDRAGMLLLGGTGPKSKAKRRPWIDWIHTANVQANIVRDFVKWDDEPHDLASVPESFARGLLTASAAPNGPVYLCYDVDLQEDEVPAGHVDEGIGQYARPSDPAAGPAELDALEAALRAAQRPAIVAGYAGETPEAFAALGALADALGAPVVDQAVRLALPSDHPLNGSGVEGLLDEADVVLALDVDDLRLCGPTVLNVGVGALKLRAWSQDYQALVPAAVAVTATADQVVAGLLARLRADPPDVAARADTVRARIAESRAAKRAADAAASADGRIALPRLIAELDQALAGERFAITNGTTVPFDLRQWTLTQPRQHLGWAAGGGLGYGVGGAIGASLALGRDTISVDLQSDGDLLFFPQALWTAAHLRLPVLVVVHDNRQYNNTVGHAARIAQHRGRDAGRRHRGAGLDDPAVDLPSLARSFGVWSTDPISDPDHLRSALAEAIAVVRDGRPALLDVLTPPA